MTKRLAFRVDAEGLHPNTADPTTVLRAASAYYSALAAVAASNGLALRLRGCLVVDKCISFESRYEDDQEDDVLACTGLVSVLRKQGPSAQAPKGARLAMRALNDALSDLISTESCEVVVGEQRFELVPRMTTGQTLAREKTTLRCVVIRAGGEDPGVRLRSLSEPRAFAVSCESKTQAKQLGGLLYHEIEAELLVDRDMATGAIAGGEVLSFVAVDEETDSVAAWSEWFAPHRAAWERVDDLDEEIRRMRG